ncbi:MAG: hypothetical protein IE918_09770 [Campylobacterales bacterium]|nr:hypothetical protein [Campylobacterales bacterium]
MIIRLSSWIVLFISVLYSDSYTIDPSYPPLFGRVIGIAQNDTLNVRETPDYRSKKVASLPIDAYVGVETCQKIETSVWCKVYHLAQHVYEGFGETEKAASSAWVNARFLQGNNRGYVLIDKTKEGNCEYVLKCEKEQCEVVTSFETDANGTGAITSIRTEWIKRERLRGEDQYGGANNQMDGYCMTGMRIEDYLSKQQQNAVHNTANKILNKQKENK